MKYLTVDQLDDLARGAAILGSGGGGSPSYNRLITERMIDIYGPIRLLSIDELAHDAVVVPVAFMGAPLVALERIPSGREFEAIFSKMAKQPTVLMAAEIGGANAFTPLWIAAKLGIPVLDADTIGRAFPELQMSTCTLFGISSSPTYLADDFGNVVEIHSENPRTVETFARQITVTMGSRAAVALYIMSGKQAKEAVVAGSVTKAIEMGSNHQGTLLASGMIGDVNHKVDRGFLLGTTLLHTNEGDYELDYQNEFLRVRLGKRPVALTPDIITLIEQDTGHPITTANLQYGLRVDLFIFEAPPIWKTPKGMALAGPKVFGYEEEK
jgi:uncharacterized protein